MIYIIIDHCSQ